MVNPGMDYIIYQPVPTEVQPTTRFAQLLIRIGKKLRIIRDGRENDSFTVFLQKGNYDIEWFDPLDESTSYDAIEIGSDGKVRFNKPNHIRNDAVLFLRGTNQKVEDR
jgi:hypothetical protein